MTFTPQFLDEIRTRLPCSDVIGRRVRLVKKGREHSGLCPFHNEKSPSFTVNDDKGFFHCFGCGAHGDVIGFTMKIDNLAFPEAVERLADEAGLEMPRFTPAERERAERQQTLYDVVEAACVWFEKQLTLPAGKPGLDYLHGRGLSDVTLARFRLGYAPDSRDALRTALLASGVSESLLFEAGLIARRDDGTTYDFFRGRVIFPIMDRRGRVIAFGGRILVPREGVGKYVNSRETPLFEKGRNLYALDKARAVVGGTEASSSLNRELIVAEGYMDVIALHEAGFGGAVAPLGTAITPEQIEALWKIAPEPILCLDGDAAGQRAALRAAERALPLLKPGLSLRFAVLPGGEDPDSLIRKHGAAEFAGVLTRTKALADVIWEAEVGGQGALDTPERRAGLQQRLGDRLKVIADRSVQQQYYSMLVRTRLWETFRSPRRKGPQANPPLRHSGLVASREGEILLATLINHPILAADHCEALAALALGPPEFDQILKEILHFTASGELDSDALKSHLMSTGLAAAAIGVLQPSLYKLWAFAGPTADPSVARRGLEHLLTRFDERRLELEVREALQDWGAEASEQNQQRLTVLQEQLRQTGLRGAALEDEVLGE